MDQRRERFMGGVRMPGDASPRDPFDRMLSALREFEKLQPHHDRNRYIYVMGVMIDVLYAAFFKAGKLGAADWQRFCRTLDRLDDLVGRVPALPAPQAPEKSDLLQWLEELGDAHAGEDTDPDGAPDAGTGDQGSVALPRDG
jgi:hypothetical protein